jgi:hypothetical protein
VSDLELALACSLYAEGFRFGAGPRALRMSPRERTLERAQDKHFIAGVRAGREAARKAREAYRAALLEVEPSAEPR